MTPAQIVQLALLDEARDAVRIGVEARAAALRSRGKGGAGGGALLKDKDAIAALARNSALIQSLEKQALARGGERKEIEVDAKNPMTGEPVLKDGKPVKVKTTILVAKDPRTQAELDGIQALIDQAIADRDATLQVSSDRVRKHFKTIAPPKIGDTTTTKEPAMTPAQKEFLDRKQGDIDAGRITLEQAEAKYPALRGRLRARGRQ